jgi:hypothetical protein
VDELFPEVTEAGGFGEVVEFVEVPGRAAFEFGEFGPSGDGAGDDADAGVPAGCEPFADLLFSGGSVRVGLP